MLQYSELKARAAQLDERFTDFWRRLDLRRNKERLNEIEKQISAPGAWDKPELLTPVLQEKTQLESRVDEWEALLQARDNALEWVEMAAAEQTQEMLQALEEALEEMSAKLEAAQMRTLLSDPEDVSEAILEIHPGAGGTESQDWAEMLLRMYRRFSERAGFKVELLDLLPGDEAGIKSVTLHIHGPYAYGQLKGEKGTHRLIRISPFDSSGRRHTSFASVDVYPDAGQDIEIEIRDEDVRVDIFRSSGPGGQSVNTTDSAVRVTHIPTGLVAQCQNEKSQHKNKEAAMKVLKARLYELELQKIASERQAEYVAKGAIAFGSQIRTYTLQPYRLVKDHRTGTDTSNVDSVLDGNIDAFIHNYLLYLHGKS
ncbi:peptide chain release factor 2 [Desulfomicrobium sp. ZS1]|uniref:peptide chain release factor 2 n=1 Tax=Desulfomicrobium sp. ZS1 TaxID=2952228 RepID=UPI0020B2A314|nr:peptide chain release factor 2 [Desulfomicrobium sp. ZS1]UTF50965.1 peptide chain release factor 2 [Desulfomicrobium sp. ZS1]